MHASRVQRTSRGGARATPFGFATEPTNNHKHKNVDSLQMNSETPASADRSSMRPTTIIIILIAIGASVWVLFHRNESTFAQPPEHAHAHRADSQVDTRDPLFQPFLIQPNRRTE